MPRRTYGRKRRRTYRRSRRPLKRRRTNRRRATVGSLNRRVGRLAKNLYGSVETKVYDINGARDIVGSSWATGVTSFWELTYLPSATDVSEINAGSGSDTGGRRVGGSAFIKNVLLKFKFDNANAMSTAFANCTFRVIILKYVKMDGATAFTDVSTFFQDTTIDSFYEVSELRQKSFKVVKDFYVTCGSNDLTVLKINHFTMSIPINQRIEYINSSASANTYYLQVCCDQASYGGFQLYRRLTFKDA